MYRDYLEGASCDGEIERDGEMFDDVEMLAKGKDNWLKVSVGQTREFASLSNRFFFLLLSSSLSRAWFMGVKSAYIRGIRKSVGSDVYQSDTQVLG